MKILLTGIGGFVGSHIMTHILKNTDYTIVGIASWQHKGTPERIEECKIYQENKNRVTIITHDLNAPFTEQTKKHIGKIDYIINVASDSHVDRSITDPVPFVQNNVNLVLNILEFAKEVKPRLFIQFSTDEVYGAAPKGKDFKEWSSIIPSNPYSASKAAQEAIAISYWRTYSVPLVITNTMNVYGERQDTEKYIAMCIKKIYSGEALTIHGSPNNIGSRYYIHARNVADAILFLLKNVELQMYPDFNKPARFNIVGEREVNNLEMAQMIANIIGKPLKYELSDFHANRPGHDRRYALDGSKLKAFGWTAPKNLEDSLANYVEWTLKNPHWL